MPTPASVRPRPLTSLSLALAASLVAGCRDTAVARDDAPQAPQVAAKPASPATARTVAEPKAEAPATPDPARLAADVAWLADDARAGRRSGTAGERAAADWIAARFAALGLEPAGEGGFLQEFPVPLEPTSGGGSRFTRARSSVEPTPGMSLELEEVVATQPEGSALPLSCSEGGRASGRLVYCGFGIEAPDKGWDDFAGKDLRGAIALVVRGVPSAKADAGAAAAPAADPHAAEPHTADPHAAPAQDAAPASPSAAPPHGAAPTNEAGFAGMGSILGKIMAAKRHGAVGVALLPRDPDEALLAFGEGPRGRAGIPAIALSARAAERIVGNYWDGLDRDSSAANGAPSAAADLGSAEVVADVAREKGRATNVLARLAGRDRSRTVVVGAHFDHLGHGGEGSLAPRETGSIHNGADDNASGTAVVLEAARLLAARGAPACDVVFALWSGEELGLLGSEHWAERATIPLEGVVANVNLDMVGRAGNGKLQLLGAGTAGAFAGWVAELARESGLDLTPSLAGGALGGSSDHQAFLKRKIPALHLFSGLHGDYHKPSDDADKVEPEGMAKVARLTVALVDRLGAAGDLAYVEPPTDDKNRPQVRSGFRSWFGSMPNYAYEGQGVKIDGTSPGSPAERAGFVAGDVLLEVGDVAVANLYDFMYALERYKPGDVVRVVFERDGERQENRVTLASRQAE